MVLRLVSDRRPASPGWRWSPVLAALILVVLSGCSSDGLTETVSEPEATSAPSAPPTVAPESTTGSEPEPTSTATAVPPACADVPVFQAAGTVSIACSADYAVSPELFASNAGWHLFEAQGSTWVEIDYARTCCEAGDVSFAELLDRNGLRGLLPQLCAAAGIALDPATGCSAEPKTGEGPAETTWLRVNGLGEHDFGAAQDVVLATIEQAFGPADSVSESPECGAGSMTIAFFNNFTVQFHNNELIGWFYTSSSPTLTTPSGVTVGISEADLTVVYDGVEIRDDSLGREFFFEVPAGFMAGFISESDATVTSLHAGTNCFFR